MGLVKMSEQQQQRLAAYRIPFSGQFQQPWHRMHIACYANVECVRSSSLLGNLLVTMRGQGAAVQGHRLVRLFGAGH